MNIIQASLFAFQLIIVIPPNLCAFEIKHNLRVASELNPHYLEKLSDNGRYTRYKGFVKDFCEELVNILGYQYEIVLAQEQRAVGQTRANISGYYTDGIFGMLVRNEADMAFGDTEITMERSQNFDFSSPVLNSRFAILYKRRNESLSVTSSQWSIFTPFPIAIWISFLVLSILYFGFLKFHLLRPLNSSKFKSIPKLKYSRKFAQVILGVWMFFLFTSYISNYTAQKLLQATSENGNRPTNVLDIISQKNVKIGWLANGPVERFFRNTVSELYQKIYLQNIGRDWVSSVQEGVNKVLSENGNFALILDSLIADHETQMDCTLYKLPQEFGPIRPIAVATPIGSPLRERINQAVLSLSEQGIIEAIHNRWFSINTKNGPCTATSTHQKSTATATGSLKEMSPIFILAVVGLFLATIICLLEIHVLKQRSTIATTAPQPKPPRQQVELLQKFNLESV